MAVVQHVKPIAGTDRCEMTHVMYCISGRLNVVHEDGSEAELGPGDVAVIEPGHDAWVVGDEPYVAVDFGAYRHPVQPAHRFAITGRAPDSRAASVGSVDLLEAAVPERELEDMAVRDRTASVARDVRQHRAEPGHRASRRGPSLPGGLSEIRRSAARTRGSSSSRVSASPQGAGPRLRDTARGSPRRSALPRCRSRAPVTRGSGVTRRFRASATTRAVSSARDEVARVHGRERHRGELIRERAGLVASRLVQRPVGLALYAAFGVPVRLAVAHEQDRRLGHLVTLAARGARTR